MMRCRALASGLAAEAAVEVRLDAEAGLDKVAEQLK
jgi:hypothetical protein